MIKFIYFVKFNGYCGKKMFNIICKLKKIFSKVHLLNLPKKKTKFTMIKSPHNFNKSREHFETIVFKGVIYLSNFYSYLKNIFFILVFRLLWVISILFNLFLHFLRLNFIFLIINLFFK